MNLRSVAVTVLVLASASLLPGSDLSRYRGFHLGMTLADVAKQAGTGFPETKSISTRPERIEELLWRTGSSASATTRPDSVREIRFGFYNGSLFEMMVAYDTERTAGMSDSDMTEALSAIYGAGSVPAVKEMTFNSGYKTNVRVIAQWGDSQTRLSLVSFPYGGGFGLVIASTTDQALARTALTESERLDRVEAPQRELDQQAKRTAEAEVRDEKSRILNKPGFRP